MAQAQGGWTIEEYTRPDGESPFQTFFNGLTGRHLDDAVALLLALREHGNMLRPPRSKQVENNLFELRGYQVRIFYIFRPGRRMVLLDGIIKKTNEIPKQDLKRVRQFKREVEGSP
jgi:phage-related protein